MNNNNQDIPLDIPDFEQSFDKNQMFTFVSKQEPKAFDTKIKAQKTITPKQEVRVLELEECIKAIKKELHKLEDSENYSDITMYRTMIKEYKQLIYNLKNQ